MKSMRFCILVILFIGVLKCSADEGFDKDDEDDATSRFHRPHREQECNYRRQPGKCRRKSECKRPTRRTCRHGRARDPIICCLDLDEMTTTTTKMPTTTKRITTKRPTKPPVVNKPDNIKNINLTFPNCGLRSPKIQEVPTRPPTSNRRRGILPSFIGRSDTNNRRQGSLQGIRPVVVGGVETKPHSWPWMVAIFRTAVPGAVPKYLCGASLISRRYVVSAAHCFDPEKGDIDASKFTIVVGAHTTKDGIIYPVEQVHVHTGYQKRQYYYDISLLKTSKPVILTKKVYPICLPSDDLRRKIVLDENRVTVTGWGDTAFGGISSKVLQEVTMPVVPLKDCNESFSKIAKANFPRGITNLFICAGEKQGGKDACQGDSGGPLVTKLKDNSYVQLGVVSFGYGCGQAGYPGVYTRLSEYTKWFYENTDLG